MIGEDITDGAWQSSAIYSHQDIHENEDINRDIIKDMKTHKDIYEEI